MKITIDIRLLTKGGRTGIPGYTHELTDTLIKNYSNHTFTLFYNGWSRQPLPEPWRKAQNVRIIESGIPNRLLDVYFKFGGKIPPPVNDGVLPLEKGEGVIFSPHFNLLPASPSQGGPQSSTPRIITFHDLSFIHYPQFFSLKQRLWHRWQNWASQAKQAAHIIAVSEYTKSDLVNFLKIPEEKITVIYSGIGPEFLMPNTYHLSPKTRPYFLFLGTMEPRKNIRVLIKAFDLVKQDVRFKDHELVIAGRPGYRAKEVYKTAAESPYSENIRFLSNVSDTDRMNLYSNARAFVFPSWFEGFGFPPLEAQACGVPVIASDRTSLPEILGSSALYFSPWRTGELADQMKRIETDSKVRDNIVSAGAANVKKFTWLAAAAKLMNIFESYGTRI